MTSQRLCQLTSFRLALPVLEFCIEKKIKYKNPIGCVPAKYVAVFRIQCWRRPHNKCPALIWWTAKNGYELHWAYKQVLTNKITVSSWFFMNNFFIKVSLGTVFSFLTLWQNNTHFLIPLNHILFWRYIQPV